MRAHHVVMAAAVVLVLVAGNAIVEGDFTRQSALGQQLERAVYGGESNARIALAHELVKLLRREMFVRLQECKQDSVALFGLLEANPLQMLMEPVLRLAQRFPRDRSVIINAFLEHASDGLSRLI